MPRNRKTATGRRRFLVAPSHRLSTVMAGIVTVALLVGCGRDQRALSPADLTPAERTLVDRFLVLERARAVALADTAAGRAVLDSLAAAWGDTSLAAARRALPSDHRRVAALYDLMARLLQAERDSLLAAPSPRRLGEPWPTPVPPTGR